MQSQLTSYREPWVDALRAMAVLGVFLVNAMGYPFAPNYPLTVGAPQPLDSLASLLINGFLVAFIQGKAWPLLCFLFGYSLCSIALQSRAKGLITIRILRVRYWKLLLIGLLHGAWVYFGDILTAYAVCGLVCAGWALSRPAVLLKIWKWLTIAVLVWVLLLTALGASLLLNLSPSAPDAISAGTEVSSRFFLAQDIFALLSLNMRAYFAYQVDALSFMPIFLWLTVAGMLARRFRLLSAKRTARLFWLLHVPSWQLLTALFLNIMIGTAVIKLHTLSSIDQVKLSGLATLNTVTSVWLTMAWLAWAMRRWHKYALLPQWVAWLAPAGRHTLAMYLSLSVILMLTSTPYLGLSGTTATRLMVVLMAWVLAICTARYASSRGKRDPIARWLSVGASSRKVPAG
jgi:uncharacterized protein